MEIPQKLITEGKAFRILKNEIDSDKLSHAYMISGNDKGETSAFAMTVIQYSLCRDLCGKCPDCLKIKNKNHSDITLLESDDRILTDDVKNIIADSHLKPFESADKYFVICDAGNMTAQSQNKLLKTLEEAPSQAHFFLCTVKPDALLNTVKSRLIKITLPAKKKEEIAASLNEMYADKDGIRLASVYSGGSLTAAHNIMSDPTLLEAVKTVDALPGKLKTSKDVLSITDEILKHKYSLSFILDAAELLFSGMIEGFIDNDYNEYGFSLNSLAHIIYSINESKKKLSVNCNALNVTEFLLFKILEAKKTCR